MNPYQLHRLHARSLPPYTKHHNIRFSRDSRNLNNQSPPTEPHPRARPHLLAIPQNSLHFAKITDISSFGTSFAEFCKTNVKGDAMLKLFRKRSTAVVDLAPISPTRPVERRSRKRKNTYADIAAVSAMGTNRKRGIVLDLSDSGARIRFERGDNLIDGMLIKIARYGIVKSANVRWRTRTDVGVEFIPDQS